MQTSSPFLHLICVVCLCGAYIGGKVESSPLFMKEKFRGIHTKSLFLLTLCLEDEGVYDPYLLYVCVGLI